ncbi:MAG: hypothetical protein LBV18_02345 [Alistipes sp.]|nr:hypothetical protein [Alistipes sp.]
MSSLALSTDLLAANVRGTSGDYDRESERHTALALASVPSDGASERENSESSNGAPVWLNPLPSDRASIWESSVPLLRADGTEFSSRPGAAVHSVTLGWGASVPIGKVSGAGGNAANGAGGGNFVGKTSWIAPSVGWEWRFANSFSGGVSVGYVFVKEEGANDGRISGDVGGNYEMKQSLMPVEAKLKYYPLGSRASVLRPYAAVTGGVAYSTHFVSGDVINREDLAGWGGSFSAGLGMRVYPIPVNSFFMEFSGAWQWVGAKFERMNLDARRRSGVGIYVGAGFDF